MTIRMLVATLLSFSASQLSAQLKGGAFRVAEDVMQRRLIHKVDTVCPGDARIHGQVILKAIVDTSGKVENLQMLNGHPMLIPPAIDAVKQWTYKPFLVNGEPVKVETTIHLNLSCSPVSSAK